MIIAYIAEGFEEIEALATVDILRRCDFEVLTVGVGSQAITGSHSISVLCDGVDNMVEPGSDIEAVILPGGMPGTLNEERSKYVQSMIDYAVDNGIYVCAICAAPSILGHKDLLDGKKATCFPGFEDQLGKAEFVKAPVVCDDKIITANGAGSSFKFAFEIASALGKTAKANKVRDAIQCEK